jgi:hypothetical protein
VFGTRRLGQTLSQHAGRIQSTLVIKPANSLPALPSVRWRSRPDRRVCRVGRSLPGRAMITAILFRHEAGKTNVEKCNELYDRTIGQHGNGDHPRRLRRLGGRRGRLVLWVGTPERCCHGVTISTVAVAWTLAWPGVTGAIVGARTAAQVDDWILAASLLLTPQDLDEIGRAIANTGAGSGPVHPE